MPRNSQTSPATPTQVRLDRLTGKVRYGHAAALSLMAEPSVQVVRQFDGGAPHGMPAYHPLRRLSAEGIQEPTSSHVRANRSAAAPCDYSRQQVVKSNCRAESRAQSWAVGSLNSGLTNRPMTTAATTSAPSSCRAEAALCRRAPEVNGIVDQEESCTSNLPDHLVSIVGGVVVIDGRWTRPERGDYPLIPLKQL